MNERRSFWRAMWELWYPQRYDLLVIISFCALLILFGRCTQPSVKTDNKADKYLVMSLDKNKRVLLKDTPEEIEIGHLQQNNVTAKKTVSYLYQININK